MPSVPGTAANANGPQPGAMSPPSSGWQELTDFSPGIYQLVSPTHPPGAAQAEGTARCYAIEGGALAPLPRLIQTIAPPALPIPQNNLANIADDGQFRIIGLHGENPVFWPGETTPGIDQNNTEVFMGVEYWDHSGPGGASKVNFVCYRYLRHSQTNPRWETVWSAGDVIDYQAYLRPKYMAFGSTRSNNTNHFQAGPSVTVFVVSGHAQMFPDDLNASVNGTRYLPGDIVGDTANTGGLVSPANLVCHQGKVVLFPLLIGGAGSNTVTANNEAFYWTRENDARNIDPLLDVADVDENGVTVGSAYKHYFNQFVGNENPTGYGLQASLTADELFLLKTRGGAVVLRGDLNAVSQATTLPYVRGTGMSLCGGTRSPLGFLYPVDSSGVWAWNGGEVSDHLTPHMDPDFWRPPATSPARLNEGQTATPNAWGDSSVTCCDWNEFVLFPNNWLLDTDAPRPTHGQALSPHPGAWWKIDDGEDHVIHFWWVDWRGRKAYGAPSGYRHQGDPALYEYSMPNKARTYSWRSQPVPGTIDQAVTVQQLGLCVSGVGVVRLTCRSSDDTVGKSMAVTVDDPTMPKVRLSSCGVTGTHVVFDIESEAPVDDVPAPTVHGIRWLATPNSPVPASQT